MFCFGFKNSGNTLPKSGLLFYSRLPNAYLTIDWDEELGWESPMLGYQATPGDDTLFAAAPQLYDGEADTPLILSGSEIDALSGINISNVLFKLVDASLGTGKLAVYEVGTDEAILAKARRYLKIPAPPQDYTGWVDQTGAMWADESGNSWDE